MSGKTVKRVETTTVFDNKLGTTVRRKSEFFLGDDWPRTEGDRGVFRPTQASRTTRRLDSGSWSDHYFASGVYIKKDGIEGIKTHYEFDTPAVVEIVQEAADMLREVEQ